MRNNIFRVPFLVINIGSESLAVEKRHIFLIEVISQIVFLQTFQLTRPSYRQSRFIN